MTTHKRRFMMVDPDYVQPTSIQLTLRLKRRAVEHAKALGITRTEFIRAAIEEKCERLEAECHAHQAD